MGFLARGVATEVKSVQFDKLWDQMTLGKSKAGPAVNEDSIFKVSAAFACMRALSQGCAQVPFKLMQDYEADGLSRKRVAREHPIYDIVTAKPNAWQSGFEMIETMVLHASLGNAYVYKNIGARKLQQLIVLDPSRVRAELSDELEPLYHVRGRDGKTETLDSSLIWHLRGPSWDGFLGMNILKMAREALGLSMALEDSVASLHANGVRPTGVYSVDATLDDAGHARLTNWLKKQAAAGAGTPLVLDRGAKWLQQTMTSIDAQTLEERKHQIEEICRFFGVHPQKVYYTDKTATHASAEEFDKQHDKDVLGPWFLRIERSADISLLTDKEREQGYYFNFVVNALMRTNAKDRAEYYARALGSGGHPGWMSPDEVRALEDMDPMGGEAAKLPRGSNGEVPPKESPEA
jgi:HK97 family phage portal protein